eukprot:jgi/Ulvmu1/4178/UM019_0157.1
MWCVSPQRRAVHNREISAVRGTGFVSSATLQRPETAYNCIPAPYFLSPGRDRALMAKGKKKSAKHVRRTCRTAAAALRLYLPPRPACNLFNAFVSISISAESKGSR